MKKELVKEDKSKEIKFSSERKNEKIHRRVRGIRTNKFNLSLGRTGDREWGREQNLERS